jgi:hypothetical protein
MKYVLNFYLKFFFEMFFSWINIQRVTLEMPTEKHVGLYIVSVILYDFNQNRNVSISFSKPFNTKFH